MNQQINGNNKYNISRFFKESNIVFNITSIIYSFSFKYNITRIRYNIAFYDKHQNIIIPSDLTLYNNLQVFCIMTISKENQSIISFSNIYKNKYFSCIELLKIKEIINFGIRIYKIKKNIKEYFEINMFNEKLINYNNYIYKNDHEFIPIINYKRKKNILLDKMYEILNLKNNKLLYKIPYCSIKENIIKHNSIWHFRKIYNDYFCFCKFSSNFKCYYENINKYCKYTFYLSIIDNNKLILNKTDYLLADFSPSFYATGESYIIFQEMIKKNINAHYMTKKKDIFKKYAYLNEQKKLGVINFEYIDGDFLQKYLDLILKLKSVISGALIFSMSNLFKHIEYITYICVGHGISYFKDFLYKNYYGFKRYDKILIPGSEIIISNAIKLGWKINDIIQIGLPRWDIFYEYEHNINLGNLNSNNLINKKTIFIMFTWRAKRKKQNISKYYFKNIVNLVNDKKLNKIININNITLYFAYHHTLARYKNYFTINKSIKYISQNNIIDCLKKSLLVITDFSSVIFDFIVRNKPYIIYIPDSEEPNLDKIYIPSYYNIINRMKYGNPFFENKFFTINETINKIEFYIKNDFKLDYKLKKSYSKFNFRNKGNNTIKFIEYLNNMN